MFKKLLMCIGVIGLCFINSTANADGERQRYHEFRGFKNAIIIEESETAPLIEAGVVYFTVEDGILVDTKYPSPELIVYPWNNYPKIFYTDSNGIPSEIFISIPGGYIITGDKILTMPCKIE